MAGCEPPALPPSTMATAPANDTAARVDLDVNSDKALNGNDFVVDPLGAGDDAEEVVVNGAFGVDEEEETARRSAAVRARAESLKEGRRSAGETPVISAELRNEMVDAAVPVDTDPDETLFDWYDWDREDPDLSVGLHYPSMNEFRIAIRQYAIMHEFDLKTEKSTRKSYRVKCATHGCAWKVVGNTQADGTVRIQISRTEHTCPAPGSETRVATQSWVADRVAPILKEKPNARAVDLAAELRARYGLEIPYSTVWKGKQRAMDWIYGSYDSSFDWLYRFKAQIEKTSPNSIVVIDTVKQGDNTHFSRFFCSFFPCYLGFGFACRPYLSIDSTALTSRWGGHLAAANGLDGHNWMYPVAFGLFDAETAENWTWFMRQLKEAVCPESNGGSLCISSDAGKGLLQAVQEVFPDAEHRECFKHLMDNLKRRYTGPLFGDMYAAAYSYLPDKFEKHLNKVVTAKPAIGRWLEEHHKLIWSRSKFSTHIRYTPDPFWLVYTY